MAVAHSMLVTIYVNFRIGLVWLAGRKGDALRRRLDIVAQAWGAGGR